jgi:hypothetical protein
MKTRRSDPASRLGAASPSTPTRGAVKLAAAVGALLAAGVALTGTAVAGSAAPPCSPSTSSIDGGSAINYCGPATATLTIGGKTYTFKNGFCQSIHVSDIKLDVTLGTIVQGKSGTVRGNAGKPYFALDLSSGADGGIVNTAYSGGKEIADGSSVSYSGGFATKGTFKSTFGAPLSGSWNCHGVFVKH